MMPGVSQGGDFLRLTADSYSYSSPLSACQILSWPFSPPVAKKVGLRPGLLPAAEAMPGKLEVAGNATTPAAKPQEDLTYTAMLDRAQELLCVKTCQSAYMCPLTSA